MVQHPWVQRRSRLDLPLLSNQIVKQMLPPCCLSCDPGAVRKFAAAMTSACWCRPGRTISSGIAFLRTQWRSGARHAHRSLHSYIWSVLFFIRSAISGADPFDAIFGLFGQKVHLSARHGQHLGDGHAGVCTLIMIVVNGLRLGGKAIWRTSARGDVAGSAAGAR